MSSQSSVRTYPPAKPHRITASNERARTAPASGGFMMRHHDMDDFDDQPEKKLTQEEQDVEDEKARKRAMRNLINSWQERLQLISVITTFFATTEAAMLVNTKPTSSEFGNNVLKAANAGLLGALILHVYASVLSFLGAFLLISYKLREARREELIAEGVPMTSSPVAGFVINDVEQGPIRVRPGLRRMLTSNDAQSIIRKFNATTAPEGNNGAHLMERPVFSADPHIEHVIPFLSHTSSHRLLSRTHAICVSLAALGFILALIGILSYAWALHPASVSIFASACLGVALLTMVVLGVRPSFYSINIPF